MDASPRGVHQRYDSLADLTAQPPGIGIFIEQAIDGCQGLRSRQTRVSKGWRQWDGDGLCRSALEAKMRDNLISFGDRHIFNQQANRTFALAHRGLGIIPELTKAFWHLLDLRTLLRVQLMPIASVVLLFDGSGLFQLTQFGIPFGF